MLVYLFIYVLSLSFFFLLNTAAWTLPCRKVQYGSACKSESRGQRQKTRENHQAKFSARWLPTGIIWGPEIFFSPLTLSFLFPAWWATWKAQSQHCCWHNHSGTAVTALLAWHLLLSYQRRREWGKRIEEERRTREGERRQRMWQERVNHNSKVRISI